MRRDYSNSVELLNQMPCSVSELPAWFQSLSDGDFNRVCVSAVTSLLVDEQEETGFISVRSSAQLTEAVRHRYQKICGFEVSYEIEPPKARRRPVQRHWKNAKLNEWQVRIARSADRQLTNAQMAEIFEVTPKTVRRARVGETWGHLTLRKAG